MRVSLMTGFALAFPLHCPGSMAVYRPGAEPDNARLWGCCQIPAATILFLGGMAFAYFVMLPTALPFLLNFMGINTIPRPSSYVKFVTSLMFWIGIAFEFPLVIFMARQDGLGERTNAGQQWRLAVVIIAVVAAMITPTVDPVNMSLVMLPMIAAVLFSIILGICRPIQTPSTTVTKTYRRKPVRPAGK